MMIDYYQMGRRIASVRELRDMTQQELADKAGLTQATVARIEKNRKKRVVLDSIEALASALDVSLDYVVWGKGELREEAASASARAAGKR